MNQLRAAGIALPLAQAMTGWAAIFHVMEEPFSPFVIGFTAAALAVTLRGAMDSRDRAVNCFAAGMLTTGLFAGSLLDAGLLLWVGRPGGPGLPTTTLLLLAASVLFVTAGAFYWVHRPEEG